MGPVRACPSCGEELEIQRLRCAGCSTVVEGSFRWPRLARLSREDQQLVELLILCSGSLKDVATKLKISYPTIRKRLDELIRALEKEVHRDAKRRQELVKDVEAGKRSAGAAAKQILEET